MGLWSSKPNVSQDVNWLETAHFVNTNNCKIHCKYWEPDNTPRALVFVVHGLGEHCGWYDHFGKELSQQGVLVFSHDHVGHGLSDGHRAHINSFSEYTQDVVQHVQKMKDKYPGLPVFALAHSMGGLITVKVTLDHPDLFKGILLIGPLLMPSPETATPFRVRMARAVAYVSPKYQVARVESKFISHDEELNKGYDDDPLVYHGGARARSCVCMLDVMSECQKRFAELQLPIYNVHGSKDVLCEVAGSKLLHEKANSSDKTLQVVEEAFHQVHNEPQGVGVKYRQEIVDWIINHI